MSLHEVIKGREPIEAVTFTQIGAKKRESAELEREVQAFLAAGGKIQTANNGEVALDFSTMPALINEFSGKLDVDRVAKVISKKKKPEGVDHFYSGENRTKKKSAYGQNITKTKYGKYIAVVAHQNKTFATPESAREWRDRQREIHGFPPAEY